MKIKEEFRLFPMPNRLLFREALLSIYVNVGIRTFLLCMKDYLTRKRTKKT